MISIRTETTDDYDQVRCVIVDAFAGSEFGHNGEAELVEHLRGNCDNLLSLVAIDSGRVVGHVMFSPVTIQSANEVVHGMGLAPMAISPVFQRTGIGAKLTEAGLGQLTEAGCPFAVVLGHPEYYPRFGFVPASRFGVSHGFNGIPQDVFFVKLLQPNFEHLIANGNAKFRQEFGPQNTGSLI